jgi:hypothetical protein
LTKPFTLRLIVFATLLAGLPAFCFAQEPGSSQYGNQFPDAPEPIKPLPHGAWQHDPTGDPPKQKTFTKKFILASASMFASIPFDVEMTQHCIAKGTCVESNGIDGARTSRGEMYRNDLIPAVVIFGFSTLVQWQHFPKKMGWIAYVPMLYGTTVHIKGGLQGLKYR